MMPMLPFHRKKKHEESFELFDLQNPIVWVLFVKFTMELINRGWKRYSSDAICHRIRWHMDIETVSEDPFKLNDHFTAFYSRKFMNTYPQYTGFFEIRVQKLAP